MRTTISLDDQLVKQVRSRAEEKGFSMSAFIAETLDDALKRPEASDSPPLRLVTVHSARTGSEIDLDRPRALEVHDDEVRYGR